MGFVHWVGVQGIESFVPPPSSRAASSPVFFDKYETRKHLMSLTQPQTAAFLRLRESKKD
jgi:hypothetical protein